MYALQQILSVKIGTWFAVGKLHALPWPGSMYRTSLVEHSVAQENTGSVFPGLEGVFALDEPFSHLAVADGEISGNSADINSSYKQG